MCYFWMTQLKRLQMLKVKELLGEFLDDFCSGKCVHMFVQDFSTMPVYDYFCDNVRNTHKRLWRQVGKSLEQQVFWAHIGP